MYEMIFLQRSTSGCSGSSSSSSPAHSGEGARQPRPVEVEFGERARCGCSRRTVGTHDRQGRVDAELAHVVGKGKLDEVDARRRDLDAGVAQLLGLRHEGHSSGHMRIAKESCPRVGERDAPAAEGGRPAACSWCAG